MAVIPRCSRPRSTTLLAGVLLLAASFVHVHSSHGSVTDTNWCWNDPLVAIDGSLLRTTVGVPASASGLTATITYTVPAGASAVLIASDTPYFPESVRFATADIAWTPGSPVPVEVTVQFAGRGATPATRVQMANTSAGVRSSTTASATTGLNATLALP